MTPAPKTIQIFLPGGDPRGIRIAEITTRILQVIEVPRSLLGDFTQMSESNQVALYFLFGESEEAEHRVYIGQTGDLRARLKSHNRDKEFWERALVVISQTNSLTQTHALFLEWYCLATCREVGRYPDENGNSGGKPHTPAPLKMDESMSNIPWEEYIATKFWVKDRDQQFCIQIGDTSEDLEQLLTVHNSTNWAYITASDPWSQRLDAEENAVRNDKLMDRVKQSDRLYFRGEGVGRDTKWPAAASILIVGIDRDEALELGREFGQDAIVLGQKGQAAELVEC